MLCFLRLMHPYLSIYPYLSSYNVTIDWPCFAHFHPACHLFSCQLEWVETRITSLINPSRIFIIVIFLLSVHSEMFVLAIFILLFSSSLGNITLWRTWQWPPQLMDTTGTTSTTLQFQLLR